VAALFLSAWVAAAYFRPVPINDALDYLHQAENLEAGRFWYAGDFAEAEDPRRYSRRPPGYAAFLVALRVVSTHPLWIAFIQSLLGVAAWVLLWHVLVRLGGPPRPGPLVLGLALAPAVLLYAQMAMSDVPFMLLVLLAFERYVAFVQAGRVRDLAWSHGLLALGLLVKPVLLYVWLFTLPLTAYALWWRGARGAPLGAAALALLVLVPAGVLGLAHRTQTGHFEVSSIQTENFLQQNAGRLLARTGEEEVLEAVGRRSQALARYPERAAFEAAAARRIILERPLAYAVLHLQGVANFFLDPGRFDLQVFFGLPPAEPGLMARYSAEGWRGVLRGLTALPPLQTAVLLAVLAWNALVAAAFAWWLLRGDVPLPVRLGALALVGYVALVTGPVGAARYRMAVYPLMLLAAPYAWDRLRRLRARPAAQTPVTT
jgi:hypothetical protein